MGKYPRIIHAGHPTTNYPSVGVQIGSLFSDPSVPGIMSMLPKNPEGMAHRELGGSIAWAIAKEVQQEQYHSVLYVDEDDLVWSMSYAEGTLACLGRWIKISDESEAILLCVTFPAGGMIYTIDPGEGTNDVFAIHSPEEV